MFHAFRDGAAAGTERKIAAKTTELIVSIGCIALEIFWED
jgi:hypothetical protein